jgi:hypothetical protein
MGKPTFQKRAKEKARADRQKAKQQRRADTKERKANEPPRSGDEDPDIAGIRPGPQPLPDWLQDDEDADVEADPKQQ